MGVSEGTELQRLLVGGSWEDAASSRTYEVHNPFDGAVASTAAAAGTDDADRAVRSAAAAFAGWASTPLADRRDVLDRAAGVMEGRGEQIAATIAAETGGTFGWGMFNVGLAASMLREAGVQAEAVVAEEEIGSHVPGKRARAVRQPAGVSVGIAPWNAPLILGTRAIAAPLAFGNTVVLKASEKCPRTHGSIAECLVDAGIPEGVANLITNAPEDAGEVVSGLVAHPSVRRINFTGSSRVGAIIAELAGKHLKRVLLELGGKAPLVVLDDADLDRAVAAAGFGAFFHQGQICMSTERIVVQRELADAFGDRLAVRARGFTTGDPGDPATMIGPLIDADAMKRVSELVQDAREKGAEVLCGGEADGPVYKPTVLRGVTPEMRIYAEETFGPVVSIVAVDGDEDAIRVANDTEYGLSSAVFSADVHRAERVAARLETGMCHINDTTVQDEPQMPFGGVKSSGWGRFGGRAAAEEFTELRWISVQDEPREYPL